MAFRNAGETVRYAGSLVTVVDLRVEGPTGAFDREVVRHPGAVGAVPVDGADVLLVRQYRAAAGRDVLEIPAGKRDITSEPPRATAERELREEVGVRPGRVEELARIYTTPGFCDERCILYAAFDLQPVGKDPKGAEEQAMSVVRMKLDEALSFVCRGEIVDGKTIAGLFLTRELVR